MADPAKRLKEVIVLGAGVIGLTTALKIQERGGYRVTIIAEILPTDPRSVKYTSHWAGAFHSGPDGDAAKRKMDQETFEMMWALSAPGSPAEGCFLRIYQEAYCCMARPDPDYMEVMPGFRHLPQDSLLPEEVVCGITYNTVTIDVPVYLDYLMNRFLAAGGSIIRGIVQHISQLVDGGLDPFTGGTSASIKPSAIVVCAGLGTRTLGGVEDKAMFPIRGQTVLLRAPWVDFGRNLLSKKGEMKYTYMIPRRSGDVIIGGTGGTPDDWYPCPRPETTRDILKRVLSLCPELAPPEIRAIREPTVEDLLPIVIAEGCGLRPGRRGGIRLEVEWFKSLDGQKRVPVVHNYGHAGDGYLSSWGSSSAALGLLEGVVAG